MDVALREVRHNSGGRVDAVFELRVSGEPGGRPDRGGSGGGGTQEIFGGAGGGLRAPREDVVSGGAGGAGFGGVVCGAAGEERSEWDRNCETAFCFLRRVFA